MKDYSIVVPVHNEAANIGPFITSFLTRLDETTKASLIEVLLVENGSTDDSLRVCMELEGQGAGLVRVLQINRPSYGEAIKCGMMTATGRYMSILECDFLDEQFARSSLEMLRNGQADLIIASKRHPDSVDERPFKRRLLTLGFNALLRAFCGYPGTDTHGLKSMRSDIAKKLCDMAITTDELFQTEIVLIAWKLGHCIREVPIAIRERRTSPVSISRRFPKVVNMIRELRQSIRRFPRKPLA